SGGGGCAGRDFTKERKGELGPVIWDRRKSQDSVSTFAAPEVRADTSVDVTAYSRWARTPSQRNRGRAILSFGGVCLDSALQWWLRLLQVFPVCDCESGSVFGLIIGDRDPVTPSRHLVVPVCNSDL